MAKGEKRMANEVNDLDSLFKQFAKKAEADAKKASSGTYVPRDYEEIKFTGLETGIPSILRAVGGPFNSNLDNTTARTITVAWIVGDDGKKFKLIRPSFQEDPNYIINRIISRVKQIKWNNGEKTYPVKDKFPEIYNIVDKNGLAKDDSRYKYDKGWTGKEILMMNVIDRAQMDWHNENKHTMLLAKSVNIGTDGTEYADEGVSSYAITPSLLQLFKYYGSWEKYDIAITKTGDMHNAFIVENATKNPERVEHGMDKYISSSDHLSAEEKGWERYDLEKLYRVTTSHKIYNHLKGTIARIDTALGTHFLSDLEAEVEKEKVLFNELYGDKDNEGEVKEVEEVKEAVTTGVTEPVKEESKPVARTRATATPKSDSEAWKTLPYGDTLEPELRNKIKSVTKLDDEHYSIEWDLPLEELASCPTCEAVAPLEATVCPCCGLDFNA